LLTKYKCSAKKIFTKTSLPEFNNGLSYPGCGAIVQQNRHRRSSDDKFDATPFLVGGRTSSPGFAPWHASLSLNIEYDEERQEICGGSLISQRAVLTGK
jgi:Trypsin